jgi:hypothetical protein
MEVKEFVKTILKEVTEAVKESNNDKCNFYLPHSEKDGIDFDLAVVSKKEGKGKIGAEVLGIGGKTEGSISNESVNRIKFKVSAYIK